jgi:radical SAM protein (TIGR01212 family)
MTERYLNLNAYLRGIFGCRVQKITLDAGLTCPNRDGTLGRGGCIYCNPRGSGTGAHAAGMSIADQLEAGKRRLAKRYKARKFIAYFQSYSNTYGPVDRLRSLYEEALGVEDVVGLSIGTRPDCVEAGVLDLLAGYTPRSLVWIEYGLQSANDETLRILNRGHSVQDFVEATAAARRRGIKVCAHVILGLPGEGREDMLATARLLTDVKIDGVKVHLLYVVRDTPLEKMYRAGRYVCLGRDEYVERVCDFLELLDPRVVIQRLTGDPHPEELVAPLWSLKKSQTLALIRQRLAARDTWQGKRVTGA